MTNTAIRLEHLLFPDTIDITAFEMNVAENTVSIEAETLTTESPCSDCGTLSRHIHGTYLRRPADLPALGRAARLRLRIRRFRCTHPSCPRRTFAEQVVGLTRRHGRRTERLRTALAATGLALAARAAARLLSDHLAVLVSRSTLLRLIKNLPDPCPSDPRVLGVDEFAFRKGRAYGTVLVDVESRRPVELLEDRETPTVAAWMHTHPSIEVVCRDRATFYAEAADQGAPQAVQVADRWHLWHNLGQAVERCVSAHRTCLRPASSGADPEQSGLEAGPGAPVTSPWRTGSRFADRVRETHAAVHELRTKGHSHRSIQRHLGMGSTTVVRYLGAPAPEALFRGQWQNRPSKVDPFKPYLGQQWAEGHTNAWALFEEIKEKGYPGGYGMVRDYLHPKRPTAQPPGPHPPRARVLASWILAPPEALGEQELLGLKQARADCAALDALAGHVRAFARMLTRREGADLPQWLAAVRSDDLPPLRSFANGLERDHEAVKAGLTFPWSSGAVEGNVNRIKMLKRQMYGRSGFALLRKRVLLA